MPTESEAKAIYTKDLHWQVRQRIADELRAYAYNEAGIARAAIYRIADGIERGEL